MHRTNPRFKTMRFAATRCALAVSVMVRRSVPLRGRPSWWLFRCVCLVGILACLGGCQAMRSQRGAGGGAVLEDVVLPDRAGYLENGPAVNADAQQSLGLQAEVEELRTGNRGLRRQLAEAQKEIDLRDTEIERQQRMLRDAQRELEQAQADVLNARSSVRQWRDEMLALKERLELSEKEHLASLDDLSSVIALLLAKEVSAAANEGSQ